MKNTNITDKELVIVMMKEKEETLGKFFSDIFRAFRAFFACHACLMSGMSIAVNVRMSFYGVQYPARYRMMEINLI
jgi:predicted membrane-bound mannosyltransferase